MEKRRYYSARIGKASENFGNYRILRELLNDVFKEFNRLCFFDEAFGMECSDMGGYTPGTVGADVPAYFRRKVHKDLWPIWDKYLLYKEEDIFDVIEFLFDHVSMPIERDGDYHSFYQHYHYSVFDKIQGQQRFRKEVNDMLMDYKTGFELSENGEIISLADDGLQTLTDAKVPVYDPKNVEERVEHARYKYLSYKSTIEDRKDAVRQLADVLEYLRPKMKKVIAKKDEADLFELANRFSIRHHNTNQKSDYDNSIWLSWMYYYYLATIHAVVRLLKKENGSLS